MNEKPFTFKPRKCKKCGLEFELIVVGFERIDNLPKYCPNCAADLSEENKVKIVIDIPEGLKKDFETEQWTALSCMEMKEALMNGIPLSKKELSAYNKGYIDGLNQISQDLREVVEIVFSNKYPEYKEDELIELLKPYVRESD